MPWEYPRKVIAAQYPQAAATHVREASRIMTSSEDFTQRNEERRKTAVVRRMRRIALGLLMLLTTLAGHGPGLPGRCHPERQAGNSRPPADWSLLTVTSCISIAPAREVQPSFWTPRVATPRPVGVSCSRR